MELLAEIILLFLAPPLLVLFDIVRKNYRFYLFGTMILAAIVISWFKHWPLQTLGINTRDLWNGFWLYLVFTILSIIVIVCLASALNHQPIKRWWRHRHFVWGFIVLSVTQEFLYRAFLMPELRSTFHQVWLVIIINALLFAFIHIIYPDKLTNLSLSFLGGLCFAWLYYYYPNLLLASLSHSLLNFTVVYFNFFTYKDAFDNDQTIPATN